MKDKPTHFSIFSGVGGIDLAADMAGFQTVGQCEIADYPYKVLCKHWPDVPKWRDIKDVTAESIREKGIEHITLLSGGFPCTPHSVAGKHKGSADERDLWPEYRRVIREVHPKWVIGENVPGLLASDDRRFFRNILRDLAEMGYSVGWCVFGARDVGAPHSRKRLFVVAHSNNHGESNGRRRTIVSDINGYNTQEESGRHKFKYGSGDNGQDVADTKEQRLPKYQGESGGKTGFPRLECDDTCGRRETAARPTESCLGRDFAGLCGGLDGPRWPAGLGEKQHLFEPPRVAVGVKNRTNRLKALGNVVVPQQIYPILKAIHEIEVSKCQ